MKFIEELEVYKFWRLTKGCSFKEFKEQLMNKGYVIYSIESEGKMHYENSDKVSPT